MVENPVVIEVNAPLAHQRIIRLLSGELHLLYKTGRIQLEPFPETMIDQSQTSPTPDVLLFDNDRLQHLVIIEVSGRQGAKKDFRKVISLMQDYDVPEGFVYDYQSDLWFKHKLGVGDILEQPSFCETIGYDLNDFLQS
jgi:hypothetical protein